VIHTVVRKKCFQWKISICHNSGIINIIHSFCKTDRVTRKSFIVGGKTHIERVCVNRVLRRILESKVEVHGIEENPIMNKLLDQLWVI
jgi:hypothetical protein